MQTAAGTRPRLEAVDVLRGVIMIIMALDHTRDYFGDFNVNPTAMDSTTPALFFTRWITHFCAPVFFLLTGTGAFLSLQKKSTAELSRFLWTRGLWLLVLEFTLGRFGLQFNLDYQVTVVLVLWALGWSMIVLSALVHLSLRSIIIFGAVLVLGHNLLDGINGAAFGAFAPLWSFLHAPGFLYRGESHVVLAAYPIIPWIGVTALGYALGAVYRLPAEDRRRFLLRLGAGMIAAFIVIRFSNIYGDPSPWSSQPSPLFTVLSFLNTSKYPPSLLFLLMTLGPALCVLALLDRGTPAWLRPAHTFGRVPLFYYLVHFPLIHLFAVFAALYRFGDASGMFQSPSLDRFPFTQPPGWPFALPVVYAVWVLVVFCMYPLSRYWAGLKQRRKDAWLSYL